jgi:hypothetical protein
MKAGVCAPPMLGPVMICTRGPDAARCTSFGTMPPRSESSTGWRPSTICTCRFNAFPRRADGASQPRPAAARDPHVPSRVGLNGRHLRLSAVCIVHHLWPDIPARQRMHMLRPRNHPMAPRPFCTRHKVILKLAAAPVTCAYPGFDDTSANDCSASRAARPRTALRSGT